MERAAGQAQVGDVGANDLDGTRCEAGAQFVDPLWVQLEREHGCTSANKWIGECAGSSPEIEHEIASVNPRVVNQALRPTAMKLVPSPACEFLGHGGPS